MHALLLVAGCSRRLRPLTDTLPKSLLSVAGKPILQQTLENLQWAGFTSFTLVTGFEAGKIEAAVGKWFPELNVQYIHNERYDETNNAYSLWVARELAGETMALLDGDLIYDAAILKTMVASGQSCVAVRTRGEIGLEEVKVKTDADGNVLSISKEVAAGEAIGESVGIALFTSDACQELFNALDRRVVELSLVNEYYEASFQQMVDDGHTIGVVDIEDRYAIEIDTASDLQEANEFLLARLSSTRHVAV